MTDEEDKPGGSGSGNSRQTYQIDHADVVAPGASTVVNNHTVVIRFSFTIRIGGEHIENISMSSKKNR